MPVSLSEESGRGETVKVWEADETQRPPLCLDGGRSLTVLPPRHGDDAGLLSGLQGCLSSAEFLPPHARRRLLGHDFRPSLPAHLPGPATSASAPAAMASEHRWRHSPAWRQPQCLPAADFRVQSADDMGQSSDSCTKIIAQLLNMAYFYMRVSPRWLRKQAIL